MSQFLIINSIYVELYCVMGITCFDHNYILCLICPLISLSDMRKLQHTFEKIETHLKDIHELNQNLQ